MKSEAESVRERKKERESDSFDRIIGVKSTNFYKKTKTVCANSRNRLKNMIFQASRLAINVNHLHSLNRIGCVWWRSDFKRNMHLLLNKALINGEWISAKSNAELPVINPANGSIVGHVPDLDVSDVQNAIDAAHKTFHSDEWSSLTAKERSTLLKVSVSIFAFD